jgi:hypothetical protein
MVAMATEARRQQVVAESPDMPGRFILADELACDVLDLRRRTFRFRL